MLMSVCTVLAYAQSADTSSQPKRRTVELKQLTVIARKPLIVQKAGVTIVNVDALISNTGANALDVLGNTPGLQVDDDGAITLKGKAGVAVYIDGKPSQLSGADLAAYLRSLPSGVLDRIEIMSNPPASFDAAGTSGIINIITKKSGSKGFTGSITGNIGTGVYGSSNNSISWSYRHDRLVLSGNASLNILNNFFSSDRTHSFTNPDGSPRNLILQHYYEHSNRISPSGKLGLDYDLTKTARLSVAFYGTAAPYNEWGDYRSRFFNAGGTLDSSMIVNSHLRTDWTSGIMNIGFRKSLGGPPGGSGQQAGTLPSAGTGKEFSAGFDYYSFHDHKDQILATSVYAPDNTLTGQDDLLPHQPLASNIYEASAGYTGPLGKTGKLEAGWKTTGTQNNDLSQYSVRTGGTTTADDALSSQFLYRETVHAGYGTVSKEWINFSAHGGLRLETTVTTGRLPGNSSHPDTSFHRNYTDLFPDGQLSWKNDSSLTHQLFFSFGRRINRPEEGSLNPAKFLFDKSTSITGNPLLKPEFSYNVELSHVYKQNFTITVQYTDSRDIILNTYRQQGDTFTVLPGNVGRVIYWGVNSSAGIPLTSWCTSILYTEFFRNSYRQSGAVAGPVNAGGNSWLLSVNNQLKLGRGWAGEISGFYRTRLIQLQSIVRSLWYVNTTVRKKIWNDRAIINLGCRDVFHTRVFRRVINELPQQTFAFTNTFDTRVLSLSLVYQLGKTGSRTEQRRNDIKSEINRLKSGN